MDELENRRKTFEEMMKSIKDDRSERVTFALAATSLLLLALLLIWSSS